MNKYSMLILAGVLFACGGANNTQKKDTEQPTETSEVEVSQVELTSTLSPNLATKDQLLAISQIDQEKADLILSKRPYTKAEDFITTLKELFPEEVVSEVTVTLFLPINLNTAEESTFLYVPGVGEKMAHEFEEYRPYKSVDQFRREIGKYVDEEEVARYENYVFVPVNLNTASKEEILRIPGMGEKMLHEFEEYRPYQNIEQFRREIGKYVDDDELARLERYVTLD